MEAPMAAAVIVAAFAVAGVVAFAYGRTTSCEWWTDDPRLARFDMI